MKPEYFDVYASSLALHTLFTIDWAKEPLSATDATNRGYFI